jgi:hypothetical protein
MHALKDTVSRFSKEGNETNNIEHSGNGWGGIEWIHLVQGRSHWRAVVNTVMNLRVTRNVEKFLRS